MLNLSLLASGATAVELEEMLQKPSTLNWYIVPLFVMLIYFFVNEARQKHYSVIFGGVAFWLWDVFNETWNSMVYATTGVPVWGTTAAGNSALQILIGYNIEISIMFFILGMVACKMLTVTVGYEGENFLDGNKNWLNDPNNIYYKANVKGKNLTAEERNTKKKAVSKRLIMACVGSIGAVIIEILLNACGVLTWDKVWWQPNCPYILFLIGYLPFFLAAYLVHDLPRKWQLVAIGGIVLLDVILLAVAGGLGMLGPQIGSWRWLRAGFAPIA